jgi:hypothetical protein
MLLQQLLQLLDGSQTVASELERTGCGTLNKFGSQQLATFEESLKEIQCLNYTDAALLVGRINQVSFWDDEIKQQLAVIVSAKVAVEAPNTARGECFNFGRRQLQDYTAFVNYLTPSQIMALSSASVTATAKIEKLSDMAAALGLQCPTEQTFASMVAVLDFLNNNCKDSGSEQHEHLKFLKPIMKRILDLRSQSKQNMPYVLALPAQVADFESSPWALEAFATEKPAEAGIALDKFEHYWRSIPLRATNIRASTHLPIQRASGSGAQPNIADAMVAFMQGAFQRMQAEPMHRPEAIQIQYFQPPARANQLVALPSAGAFPKAGHSFSADNLAAFPSAGLPVGHSNAGSAFPIEDAKTSPNGSDTLPTAAQSSKKDPLALLQLLAPKSKAAQDAAEEEVSKEEPESAPGGKVKSARKMGNKKKTTKPMKTIQAQPKATPKAKANSKKAAGVPKEPSARKANSKAVLKRPAGRNQFALTWEQRKARRPSGCSKCRYKVGCAPSCFKGVATCFV